jgi:hypothetical protein
VSSWTQHALGRRRFLASVAALAAVAGAGPLSQTVAAKGGPVQNRTVWHLDPEHGQGDSCTLPFHEGPSPCHGCNACHTHAANKLFTSNALADTSRAHPFCKCMVTSEAVTTREYLMIFGPPRGPLHRDSFDRRSDRIFLPSEVPTS